jgi:sugar phosphate isomerase/epimerase
MPPCFPTPPCIRHIANLWTLWDHPTAASDWSLERKLAAVKAAGFDGIATASDPRHRRLAAKHGLCVVGYLSSAEPRRFRALIARNVDGGAVHINVQLGNHDTPVPDAIRMAVRLLEEAERAGAKCSVEVHRDTCTETPEKFYALAEGVRKATGQLLPVTWDFSHFAVVKHLAPPYSARLLVAPKLIQHAQQFHFRPFNGHHCQVPVTDGRGRLSHEFRQWRPFLRDTLRVWLAGAQSGREILVVPEMGPVRGGYNLKQLPSSWEDAKLLRSVIAREWKRALAA